MHEQRIAPLTAVIFETVTTQNLGVHEVQIGQSDQPNHVDSFFFFPFSFKQFDCQIKMTSLMQPSPTKAAA